MTLTEALKLSDTVRLDGLIFYRGQFEGLKMKAAMAISHEWEALDANHKPIESLPGRNIDFNQIHNLQPKKLTLEF